ncbi:MAG: hypothetical protein WAS73_17285 [Defluviicoccus sp.]
MKPLAVVVFFDVGEQIALTLARSAAFHLEDFAPAGMRGIAGFTLALRRERVDDVTAHGVGVFRYFSLARAARI